MKKLIYTLFILLATGNVFAQEQSVVSEQSSGSGNLEINLLIIAFIATALIVLLASLSMLRAFKVIAREFTNPTPYVYHEEVTPVDFDQWEKANKAKPGTWNKILGLRPLSEEKDMMLDHKFDGIAELDNPTPAWFMWLFYGSIVWGFGYLMYFHVLGYGKLQDEEYAVEMAEARAAKIEYLAKSSNNIDENSVKISNAEDEISSGQSIYNTNCVACHGDKGQGLVGPNLTDEYWLHGGSINNIFKTVKYGIPEKGMISWEKMLTPKQISDVSNYILSLKGSNPANGKAPQGDKES